MDYHDTMILITLLFVSINSRTVYMCHDDPFKDEQCLKRETLGSNDFVWVRKCKGLNPGLHCEIGLGQCKKGYLCRQTSANNGNYTCQKPLAKDANCDDYTDSSLSLPYSTYSSDLLDPANNPCVKDCVCAAVDGAAAKCVPIKSVSSGKPCDHPLACISGYLEGGSCKDASDGSATGTSLRTAKGGSFTKYTNITKYFDEWYDEWNKKIKKIKMKILFMKLIDILKIKKK